jgi:hypothetical protein
VAIPSFDGSSAIFYGTPNQCRFSEECYTVSDAQKCCWRIFYSSLCGQRIHLLPEQTLTREDDQCYPIPPKKGLFRACSCHDYPEAGKCSSSVNDIMAVYRGTRPLSITVLREKPAFIGFYFIQQGQFSRLFQIRCYYSTLELCGDHQDTAGVQ